MLNEIKFQTKGLGDSLFVNSFGNMTKSEVAEVLIQETAMYKEIPKMKILGKSREAIPVICRRVVGFILHEKIGMTYTEIGEKFGRDYATMRHHCDYLKDRMKYLHHFPTDKDLLDHLCYKFKIK